MNIKDLFGVAQFLNDHPRMSIYPSKNPVLILKGFFDFSAKLENRPAIEDSYNLKILIPEKFPNKIPTVEEIGKKIPRDLNHHIKDNILCLGSPLRLSDKIHQKPTISGFTESCIVPYLYAISYKFRYGEFPFGELAHGYQGIIDDYIVLFGLKTPSQVVNTFSLLSMKKQIANKKPCPCGCRKRLGSCSFHYKLNHFREIKDRSWYKRECHYLNNHLNGSPRTERLVL